MPTHFFRDPIEFAADVESKFKENVISDHTRIHVQTFPAETIRALQENSALACNPAETGEVGGGREAKVSRR